MKDNFKLSEMQESYLAGKSLAKEGQAVGCHIYFEFAEDDLDFRKLNDSWNELVKLHDMLRAKIEDDGTQYIKDYEEYKIEKYEVEEDDFETNVLNLRKRMSHKVYDSSEYPLYEICVTYKEGGKSIIHFSIDEWIVDASSVAVLLKQLYELYHNKEAKIEKIPFTYREFINYQTELINSPQYQEDMKYWLVKLRDINKSSLTILKPVDMQEELHNNERKRYEYSLEADKWNAFKALSKENGVSPTAAILTCFLYTINNFNEHKDYPLIVTYFNRIPIHDDIDKVVGPFITTMIYLNEVKGFSIKEFWINAGKVQNQLWDDNDHATVSGVRILRELKRMRKLNTGFSIPVVFTSMINNVRKPGEKTFFDQITYNITQTPQVYLDHQLMEVDGKLEVHWDVIEEFFKDNIISKMFETYTTLISNITREEKVLKLPRLEKADDECNLTELQQSYEYSSIVNEYSNKERMMYQEFIVEDDIVERLKDRYEEIVNSTEMLKMIFTNEHTQKVLEKREDLVIPVMDFSNYEEEAKKSAVEKVRLEMTNKGFSLYEWPKFELRLIKLSEKEIQVNICVDASITDGRSLDLLYKKLFDKNSSIKDEEVNFKQYMKALQAYKKTDSFKEDKEYWENKFKNMPSGPFKELIYENRKPGERSIKRISSKLCEYKYLENRGVSLDTVLITSFIKTIKKYNEEDLTVINVNWNRVNTKPSIDEKIGEFTSLGWVSSKLEEKDYEKQIKNDAAHSTVCGLVELKRLKNMPFLPVVFTSLSNEWDIPSNVKYGEGLSKTPEVYLDNISFKERENLILCWDYDEDVFSKEFIEKMFKEYEESLKHLILKEKCKNKYIHNFIEDVAQRNPNNTAVKCGEEEISYEELNSKANKIATFLKKNGVTPNTLVGVCLEKSVNMIVTLLGILKAGGAYVPIDPSYPEERINYIVNDSKVKIVVTTEKSSEKIAVSNINKVCLDLKIDKIAKESAENVNNMTYEPKDELAYVIYTSGSTGNPKGVLVTHKNVVRLMLETQKWYGFNEKDIWTMYHSYAFDFSVWEIWGSLIFGGTLVVVPYELSRSFSKVYELLEKEKVTVFNQTPTAFKQIIRVEEEEGVRDLSLRYVIFGGEALNLKSLKKWFAAHDDKKTQLVNMYGITETTVHATYRPIYAKDVELNSSLIGKPIEDLKLYILDEDQKPVGEGEIGEICISGPGLAKGYLNRKDITKERFIENPFVEGERMYLSGDLGRYVENHDIEYMGRKDNQVKIRGFRIELGEIESVLLTHKNIKQAAVTTVEENNEKQIKAFIITNGEEVTTKEIRKFVRTKLPVYMVPSLLEIVDEFPMTVNGKLDYHKLKANSTVENETLEIPEEEKLMTSVISAEELQEILKSELKEDVEFDDDIFDLGATSLTIVSCVKKLRQLKNISVDVDVFLENPSINELMNYFEKNEKIQVTKEVKNTEETKNINLIKGNFNIEEYKGINEYNLSEKTISKKDFSKMLSVLREKKIHGNRKYLYASAGGKNAVQTYVYIKENSIEDIDEGVYYYNQEDNMLYYISKGENVVKENYVGVYKKLYDKAAFAFFFIGELAAIEPVYLKFSENLVNIDSGYMQQLLLSNAANCSLSLCTVPDIDFSKMKKDFNLNESHVFINGMLGGYKADDDVTVDDMQDLGAYKFDYSNLSVEAFKQINRQMEYRQLSKREVFELAKKKLHIRRFPSDCKSFALENAEISNVRYLSRSSKRDFINEKVSFKDFSSLLSVFGDKIILGKTTRLYSSLGDKYLIKIYVYVKGNGVEHLEQGIYRYIPEKHELILVNKDLDKNIEHSHTPFNRPHYKKCKFNIFLTADTEETRKVYGEGHLKYTITESGRMGQLLTAKQADFNMGIVPIGGLNFEKIRHMFMLNENYMLLHSFMCGAYDYSSILEDEHKENNNDIAIVGISARLPRASNTDVYWKNLKENKVAITKLPKERKELWGVKDIDEEDYYGAYIDDIDKFDYEFFNISLAEAKTIDPQERLLLEEVWKCLEKAGYTKESINENQKVGVFIGTMWGDYEKYSVAKWQDEKRADVVSLHSSIANRISYVFNFKGPSISVQTACSSSATAFSLACESLRSGKCNSAIVGGVNLINHPYHLDALKGQNIIAKEGKVEIYSEESSGLAVGEGLGVVLLKANAQAKKDNDRILAKVKGTEISSYGKTKRFGMVSLEDQKNIYKALIKNSKVKANEVKYVETSATGLAVADITEVQALKDVLDKEKGNCYISTVKANIGHLESASFIAQLSKVLLQMQNNEIVPGKLSKEINPALSLDKTRFTLPVNKECSKEERLLPLAMINSFGAYGSICSILLEEVVNKREVKKDKKSTLLLGANSEEQLREYVELVCGWLKENKDVNVQDIAYTLKRRQHNFKHKLAVIASSREEVIKDLYIFLEDDFENSVIAENRVYKENLSEDKYINNCFKWIESKDDSSIEIEKGNILDLPTAPFKKNSCWLRKEEIYVQTSKEDDIYEYIVNKYSQVSEIPAEKISLDESMEGYGLSSLIIQELNKIFEEELGIKDKTILFEVNTLRDLGDLLKKHCKKVSGLCIETPVEEVNTEKVNEAFEDDIAIVGLSGVYPDAANLEEFWENLKNGVDSIKEVPKDRWNMDDYFEPGVRGKSYAKWGGFISNMDTFDPLFFNISPREAELMDPQERKFLQIAYHTLEDAGYTRESLKEKYCGNVGVYAGVMFSDYLLYSGKEKDKDKYLSTGVVTASISNRISYFCDFHGPSITVNTMCSSVLTCLNLAVNSIKNGECKAALVGGVNLIDHPNKYILHCQNHMVSSHGRCKAFGKGGDGFVPAEGVGAIFIKPLKEAVKDHDNIYAVIKGVGINHDGKKNGYMVPSPIAQGQLIERVLKENNINPESISYVEAHGTGTRLGDPIEIKGLMNGYREFTNKKEFCAIGSVKSNIGHCESAAGIASITKVLLQMKHKKIVPNIHCDELNEEIDFKETPFIIPRALQDWESEGARRASISSFGAGGVNGYVVLEEYVKEENEKEDAKKQVFVLSAHNKKELKVYLERIFDFLKDKQSISDTSQSVENIIAEVLNIESTDVDLSESFQSLGLSMTDIEEILEAIKNKYNCSINNGNTLLHSTVKDLINRLEEAKGNEEAGNEYTLENITYTLMCGREKLAEKIAIECTSLEELSTKIKAYLDGKKDINGLYEKEIEITEASISKNAHKISLPGYPFNEKKYWISNIVEQKAEIAAVKVEKVIKTETIYETKDDLKEMVAGVLKLDKADIDENVELSAYGMDSIYILDLCKAINSKYSSNITSAELMCYSTLKEMEEGLKEKLVKEEVKEFVPAIRPSVENHNKDIAVIGIAGIAPGAQCIDKYWDNLLENKSSITECPKEREELQVYIKDHEELRDIFYGGYIKDIDLWDPLTFGISPNEAKLIDPQQRLFLQTASDALFDAGYSKEKVFGSKTGVFVGCSGEEYSKLVSKCNIMNAQAVLGESRGIIANRLSFVYNLQGPSEVIDTTCSSSLAAINRAVKSIRNNECSMAVVAGVNLMLTPEKFVGYNEAGMLTNEKEVKVFSEEASGFLRGEGVGCVILKNLDEAKKDNDRIYAVLKGSAVNHSGKTLNMTMPNLFAQEKVIKEACMDAGINRDTVTYIEAQGSGNKEADLVEWKALENVYGSNKENDSIKVSFIKPNIGHLEAASGIFALIKTVLAMYNEEIPAGIGCEKVNEKITSSSLKVLTENYKWQSSLENSRRAAVHSYGIGGVNAHVILEEYAKVKEEISLSDEKVLIVLSAAAKESLMRNAENLLNYINKNRDVNLQNLAHTLQATSKEENFRKFIIAENHSDLRNKLEELIKDKNVSWAVETSNTSKVLKDILTLESIELLTKSAVENNKLDTIGRLWSNGSTIAWQLLYKDKNPQILHMPSASYNKQSYWVRKTNTAILDIETKEEKKLNFTKDIKNIIKEISAIDLEMIKDEVILREYGFDSIMLSKLKYYIETKYDIELETKEINFNKCIKEIEVLVSEKCDTALLDE